ncbi:MAG: hypothetical protein ACI4V5_02535 [Prevotella sp.]
MNRMLLLVLLSAVSVVACAQQAGQDHEKDHVRLTLDNGKTVDGYIQKYWIDGKLFKRMNTSFVMSPLPDGKNTETYDAEKVRSIDFLTPSDAGSKYDHLESASVANPSTFKPKNIRRQFVYKEGDGKSGSVYWWNGVDSQNMQLGKMNISTIYGFRMRGDDVVVPFMTGNVISLNAMRIRYKKSHPGFVDYVDKLVLKGGKRLWDAIASDPMLFVKICDKYFNQE